MVVDQQDTYAFVSDFRSQESKRECARFANFRNTKILDSL